MSPQNQDQKTTCTYSHNILRNLRPKTIVARKKKENNYVKLYYSTRLFSRYGGTSPNLPFFSKNSVTMGFQPFWGSLQI